MEVSFSLVDIPVHVYSVVKPDSRKVTTTGIISAIRLYFPRRQR